MSGDGDDDDDGDGNDADDYEDLEYEDDDESEWTSSDMGQHVKLASECSKQFDQSIILLQTNLNSK